MQVATQFLGALLWCLARGRARECADMAQGKPGDHSVNVSTTVVPESEKEDGPLYVHFL